jgi:kynurenine formamidase
MSGEPAPGAWVDLTEPLEIGAPAYPDVLPASSLETISGDGDGRPHVSLLTTTTHSGTHIDAPRHFDARGAGIDEVGLDRLHGLASVVRIDADEFAEIGPDDLDRAVPAVRPGEMLLVSTGWENRRGTSAYERHPYYTREAAEWIVDRGVVFFGVDVVTPERPIAHRPPGHVLDFHPVLLAAGIPIAEQLRLSLVAGRRVELFALPLRIVGADGAPARVVARVLAND